MRNLLAFMMLLLLTFGGLGYYLDWFKVQSAAGTDGKTKLTLDVNTPKVAEDAARATAKLNELAHELAEKKRKEQDEAKTKSEAEKTAGQNPPAKSNSWFE